MAGAGEAIRASTLCGSIRYGPGVGEAEGRYPKGEGRRGEGDKMRGMEWKRREKKEEFLLVVRWCCHISLLFLFIVHCLANSSSQ